MLNNKGVNVDACNGRLRGAMQIVGACWGDVTIHTALALLRSNAALGVSIPHRDAQLLIRATTYYLCKAHLM